MQLATLDHASPPPRPGRPRIAAQPSAITSVHIAPSPERTQTEQFLEAAYARAFDGRIRNHYPVLISLRDGAGVVIAAAGVRHARSGPLFLEHYLDRPIEQVLGEPGDGPIDRSAIAEIGNLAAVRHGAALQLFDAIASHLADRGATHVAVTATDRLRRTFNRLGFAWRTLGPADPARIEGAQDWGRYYDADPQVIAGPLRHGLDRLQTHPAVAR